MNMQELLDQLEKIPQYDIDELKKLLLSHKQVIIIGNGGSNAVAAHIAQDYTKQLGIKSFSFTDPSRLTCYINDYGMENAYSQFLKEFSDKETLVILISSSGNSPNIIKCLEFCEINKLNFILLTGFDKNNKANTLYGQKAKLNYWVNSKNYGVVECAHQCFLHTAS